MLAAVLAVFAAPAAAQGAADCPLRDARFSLDSPFIDILLSPAARDAVRRAAPAMIDGLPPFLANTAPVSFASIMAPRTVATYRGLSARQTAEVGRALRRVAVTAQDRVARCARYDDTPADVAVPPGSRRVLVFERSTGFRDEPAIKAARDAFTDIARRSGWAVVVSDKAGVMTPPVLARFDAVVWNNVSGDVLTQRQRAAFRHYVERGGGFLGVHGSGGDLVYFWPWYRDRLIGARFIGHTFAPQFQSARIVMEDNAASPRPDWIMKDEWYSFAQSPRASGVTVVARLDEGSYVPVGRSGESIRMGDHPIAWRRRVGRGRAFYSALGHRPESYADPRHLALLEDALRWVTGR